MITNTINNIIELKAENNKWLYNTTESIRNFVKAVILGKEEQVSNWVECTEEEKVLYEQEHIESEELEEIEL